MQDLVLYKKLPLWDSHTLPKAFQEKHNTQAGTWAKLTILKGSMEFVTLTEQGDTIEAFHFSVIDQPPFIEPQQWHRIVAFSDDLQCQLAFYCIKEDYCHKKYGLTKTHSEVIEAVKLIQPCKVMDLGCGTGRNALYLQLLGFDVMGYDKSAPNIVQLNNIINDEQLSHIKADIYDINNASLIDRYDFILSTVVLMFLDRERIPSIIDNMQASTHINGYNLIVCAMSTDDFPCVMPFSFTFKEGELKDYYKEWEIIKYDEQVGELHKTDSNGQRIKLQFATLLAKKIN